MRVQCSAGKADEVKAALEKEGAQFIEQLKTDCGDTVFLCTGTMLMMVSAMGAGAGMAGPA